MEDSLAFRGAGAQQRQALVPSGQEEARETLCWPDRLPWAFPAARRVPQLACPMPGEVVGGCGRGLSARPRHGTLGGAGPPGVPPPPSPVTACRRGSRSRSCPQREVLKAGRKRRDADIFAPLISSLPPAAILHHRGWRRCKEGGSCKE